MRRIGQVVQPSPDPFGDGKDLLLLWQRLLCGFVLNLLKRFNRLDAGDPIHARSAYRPNTE
jgi:hypothetical protein